MKSNQKKYLDRVVDLIVSETMIDYDMGEIQFPFFPILSHTSSFIVSSFSPFFLAYPSSRPPLLFTKHCRDIYGLGEEETEYVWGRYGDIIKDKIRNNER